MRGARIVSTGRYLPEKVISDVDLEQLMDTSDEWITQRTGIKERRYAGINETTSYMGAAAAKIAMEKAGLGPEDIDYLIFATLSSDFFFPGSGVLAQDLLELDCVGALDVRTQCTGFIYGLSVAESFVKMGKFDHILVIGSEVQSAGLDFSTEGRDISVLFGDGAGAALVGPSEEGKGILSTHMHSEGKYARDLWCEAPTSASRPWISEDMLREKRHFPQMNGKFVFVNAVKRFKETIEESLKTNDLTKEEMSIIIPHQANLRISQAVAKSMKLPEDRVFSNIQRYGNTTAASIPIALDEYLEKGSIKDGDIVCLAAFGSGFTWGSALMRW
jgi:3-oxoacyl-[acyl-carrier-protein] synthase-3